MRLLELAMYLGDEYEDIVQEAKIKCIGYEGTDGYKPKLLKTIHNMGINELKRRFAQKNEGFNMVSMEDCREIASHGAADERIDVRRALSRLFQPLEAQVMLDYLGGTITCREVSFILGVSLGKAHMILTIGIEKLQRELRAYA